ncbi:MAG TPA: formimidoylglutamate deiminase [Acidocella sp.]|nr:formimidoylglutamate deiminase [Acidocella sp.]
MKNNLFFRHALLPGGIAENVALQIEDGVIRALDVGAVPTAETYGFALPGMPNLHSHSFQRAIAGLTERRGGAADSFWTWRDLMYRFALRMSPEEVEIVATQAFIEMLEGGFCSVAEFHYLHHAPDGTPYDDIGEMAARLAAAAAATGIELTLLPVFYAHAGFGGLPPAPAQRRFINSLESYARLLERCKTLGATGIAPHSLRAVTPGELNALVVLAGEGPVHLHIAEQTGEVEECLAFSGLRPVEFLRRHAPLGPSWCLIHATHANAAERAAIAASGAVIGLCPITEANLGDGIFPAHDYAGPWGIGSDSNVLIDAAQELRQLEYSQRLLVRQRNVLASATIQDSAIALYQRASAGGAQALGVLSGLRVGAPANIVTLGGKNSDFALSQAVFAARKPPVREVWVRGRKCVVDGRHPLAERSQNRFDAVVRKLLQAGA